MRKRKDYAGRQLKSSPLLECRKEAEIISGKVVRFRLKEFIPDSIQSIRPLKLSRALKLLWLKTVNYFENKIRTRVIHDIKSELCI
jgi:hypothetical protein